LDGAEIAAGLSFFYFAAAADGEITAAAMAPADLDGAEIGAGSLFSSFAAAADGHNAENTK